MLKRKKNILARPQYKFADRRDVHFMSTIHSASIEVVHKRPKGGRDCEPIPCPSVIGEYNKYMNAVDLADQHLSYHSLTVRKTIKWWKKLFWRLIDIVILNSSIVFHTNFPDKGIHSNREFCVALSDEFVAPLLQRNTSE